MKKFTWDEPKRLANLDKHQLDFNDVDEVEWDKAHTTPARPDRFGRPRQKAVAPFRGGMVVVIYGELGSEGVAVISFRPANVREIEALDDEQQTKH